MQRLHVFILTFMLSFLFLFSNLANASLPMQQSFAPLVKETSPAVVNIYAKHVVKQRSRSISPFFNDPFFSRFFNAPFSGRVQKRIAKSLGSGVIIEGDGLIATNEHVVKDATEINVILSDGREFTAKKILDDSRTDMAILKIDTNGENLPVLKLADSDDVEVGDIVLAIGNPFGVGQTVTSGIVSAVARTGVGISDYSFFIQTDAAINPGNSGGALVNTQGQLIGINSAIYSRSGGSLGIGFAIPANMVQTVIKAAKRGGKIIRPWTGMVGQSVTSDMLESLGLDKAKGALIKKLYKNSPAEEAGIIPGDVIISINGKDISDPAALKYRLATVDIGDYINLEVIRAGRKFRVKMKALAPPETVARNETLINGANPLSGALVANISPALIEDIGQIAKEEGVVILKVKGGTSARLGLRKKDIILSINNKDILLVKDLKKMFKNNNIRKWSLVIQRGLRIINLTISG